MKPTIILATAADQPDITASDKLYAEALPELPLYARVGRTIRRRDDEAIR
jgi:hypothetical protein